MSYLETRKNLKAQQDAAPDLSGLICRMPGCRNRWSVDISHGKVCSYHDEALSRGSSAPVAKRVAGVPMPIPVHEAVKHWQDDSAEEF